MKRKSQSGFSSKQLIIIFLIIIIAGAVIFAITKKSSTSDVGDQSGERKKVQLSEVIWQGTADGGWTATNGTAPACPSPLLAYSPVDTEQASQILYPGQYRGTDYKAHGGFRFDNNQSVDAYVRLPLDAKLVSAARYLEAGEVQYMLDFQNPCGIQIRFDHLYTLAPEFAKIADTLPAPKQDDSRTTPIDSHPAFAAGELVATAIGHKDSKNYAVDFGVYDLRQPNEVSKNATWAALHKDKASQAYYGVCWIDLLPATDKKRVHEILPLDTDDRGASDYCSFAAGGSTLQYNNGMPVTTHSTPNKSR